MDGGLASHFADLANALGSLGHRVRVITPAGGTNPGSSAFRIVPFTAVMPRWLDRITGIRWQAHSVTGMMFRARQASRAVASAAAVESFDLIETTSTGALAYPLVRDRRRTFPIVTRVSTTHDQLVEHNAGPTRWPERWEQLQEQRLVRRSDQLLTHTKSHRDEICRRWGIAPQRFGIVPHGITLPPRQALAPVATKSPVEILFVGRCERRKGIETLLLALPEVFSAVPAANVRLVGHDPEDYWQGWFRHQFPRHLQSRVRFEGRLDAPALESAYRKCHIFVAPSHYESFGLIYVEAMAWAKPVVACAVGGVPEVVSHGVTGWLTPPGNPRRLSQKLISLALDSNLRAQMGEAGRTRVEAEFSLTRLAASSVDFYYQVIAESRFRFQDTT